MPAAALIAPDVQKRLYAEADARFAAQTGITWKLDPNSWIDAALVPSWFAIYQKVLAEYRAGKIHWSIDDPKVAAALAVAQHATQVASDHVKVATAAPPGSPQAQAAAADATAAHATAAHANKTAAASQPYSVFPDLLSAAAQALASGATTIAATSTDPSVDAVKLVQAQSAPAHAADVIHITMPPVPGLTGAPGDAPAPDADVGSAGNHKKSAIGTGAIVVGALTLAGLAMLMANRGSSSGRRGRGRKRRPVTYLVQGGAS